MWHCKASFRGTIQRNSKRLKKQLSLLGEYKWRSKGKMVATTWLDNKPCHFLSTIHLATRDESVRRTSRTGKVNENDCPSCVPDYQKFMGGVDLADQRIGSFHIGHKATKWTRCMFFQLIDTCTNSAFIIYKHAMESHKTLFLLHYRT